MVVTDPWANAEDVRHEYGINMGRIDAANKVDYLVVAVGQVVAFELLDMRGQCGVFQIVHSV